VLRVHFLKVREDRVERLRWWMAQLNQRQEEVSQTFAQETVRHEIAYLLEARDGPMLVYIVEANDVEQASRAYQSSTLPIDLEHRQVMQDVSAGPAAVEMLYECRMPEDPKIGT